MIEAMLKSTAISIVLYGYYWLFLRNRNFHRWNRKYLLATVLLSLIIPFVPIPDLFLSGESVRKWTGVLHAVVPGHWTESEDAMVSATFAATKSVDWITCVSIAYGLVVCWLGAKLVHELGYIARLYRRYPSQRRDDILFLFTKEPGTPFSFLKTIFWHDDLDMESPAGQQMLRYELVHVRQRHTLDLLLLRPAMIMCWINPVFYLIYRELRTIHEFEADHEAMGEDDPCAYAELLVLQTLGSRQSELFHSFFSSSIKRRITMITQHSANTPGYWGRLMVVPLTILLLCAFSARHSNHQPQQNLATKRKTVTVIIDAGHGGSDAGAIASNGLKEKDIVLSLARKVKQLSDEYGVNVILTRNADELAGGTKNIRSSLEYRSALVAEKKADLFISLHVDAKSGEGRSGVTIYLSGENKHFQESTRLAGILIDAMHTEYTVDGAIRQTAQHVYVLRAATAPAVLVECGNIDNGRDRAFMSDAANREKIARDILRGIVNYN